MSSVPEGLLEKCYIIFTVYEKDGKVAKFVDPQPIKSGMEDGGSRLKAKEIYSHISQGQKNTKSPQLVLAGMFQTVIEKKACRQILV